MHRKLEIKGRMHSCGESLLRRARWHLPQIQSEEMMWRGWLGFCKKVIPNNGRTPMLHWTITFLILALIAGLLGFTTVAGTSFAIAKVLFVVFLVLLVVSALSNALRGKAP